MVAHRFGQDLACDLSFAPGKLRAPLSSSSDVEPPPGLAHSRGQAGLAMGYYLAERGLSFVIADANPEVGHMWRSRWQSLKLFTAGQYNDLPGMALPGRAGYATRARTTSPTSFRPTSSQVRAAGAAEHDGDSPEPRRRRRLRRRDDDRADSRPTRSSSPPGRSRSHSRPTIADELDPELTQLHSADYQSPDDLPEGRILVVGGGQLRPADRARAFRVRARSTSRSARSCRRCRSGRSAATSGGG